MIWPTLGTVPPRLWLIDHGAALVFHHRWDGADPAKAYDFRHHALGGYGPDVRAADAELAPRVTPELLREVTAAVPDEWLTGFGGPDEARAAYVDHLAARVRASVVVPEPGGREPWCPVSRPASRQGRTEAGRRATLAGSGGGAREVSPIAQAARPV